jgi:hypothetical protein
MQTAEPAGASRRRPVPLMSKAQPNNLELAADTPLAKKKREIFPNFPRIGRSAASLWATIS